MAGLHAPEYPSGSLAHAILKCFFNPKYVNFSDNAPKYSNVLSVHPLALTINSISSMLEYASIDSIHGFNKSSQ